MILFPIALLWLIAVLIWVVRNNVTGPEPGSFGFRTWTRWRPRPPRRPTGGRPPGDRRGGSASPSRAAHARSGRERAADRQA